MRKFLPAFVLLLLVFVSARAQTKKDSIIWHLRPDTAISNSTLPTRAATKHFATDTATKHLPVDSTAKKLPVDSAIAKPLPIGGAPKKSVVDSTVVKHLVVDSVAKKAHVDSAIVKQIVPDDVTKKPKPDSVMNRPVVAIKTKSPEGAGKEPHPKVLAKPPAAAPELKHSTVKTLSDERYNSLLKGEEVDNMSLAGVLNHYPLPDKALKYKVQLGLNPDQLAKLKDVNAFLQRKKLEMGSVIISNEKVLDSLFVTRQADDGTIIFYANRYGLYQGELRNAILQACYKTREILSEDQIKKLENLEKVR